jgi:predicted ATPase
MRVAFSGTHRVGKTTLLDAVSEHLPGYATFEEPYRLLEDDGYELSDPPTRDDFERQLRRSLEVLEDERPDALFDRCPIDFLGYLRAIDDTSEVEDWLDEIRGAMTSLDLIVLVTIEEPDRIAQPAFEDQRLRRNVDDALQALVLDDPFAFGVPVLEVHGSIDARASQVLDAIRARGR